MDVAAAQDYEVPTPFFVSMVPKSNVIPSFVFDLDACMHEEVFLALFCVFIG